MATVVASPSSLSPIPSTSKRPAPSPSSSQPVKRPRQSSSSPRDEDEAASDEELDEEALAKLARKEARTIRNRESAQRSRNARKAHVAWLEKRVVELEAENRSLKGEPPTSTDPVPTATTPEPTAQPPAREASTEHDVLSFANDLGIPSEIVSSGVSLSNVAPPPSSVDVDVKPIIEPSPLTLASPAVVLTSNDDLMAIKTENANLRQRVTLLENLVKQVVAIANFSPPVSSTSQRTPVNQYASLPSQSSLDWSSTLSATSILPAGLSSTLSPGLPARNSTVSTTSTSQITQLVQTSQPELASSQNVSDSVACHSAVVATTSAPLIKGRLDVALQRARENYSMRSLALALAKDEKRMAQVARLIIALARHKGWISHSPLSGRTLNTARKGCLEERRCRQRWRVGMRR
ncbi:hypothetical protein I305_04659 [Cryptococcus gattii E566]|uniref:BZIP domain-containing protein n=2 Tax=Cryptococcus gattii TaxID=37769 RepID=E6RF93_CRYGW|nr:Hypothetical Protein CGB_M1590W [Cryptococcus gattii WM276]ADV25475.1 Hypothetical Protein CGB_M1590W [Cryptococcus gattii WM276]KIR78906.1 hypothetical protein I306_04116 [Cryptococcus gattii EJB2]KIY32906.1 hypothetical protein I305_04659 [Cryptococcus gattii E566]KJE05030.1 hypothetical protein I311_01123 [Cryptococcus gattii NT-10]